MQSVMLTSCQYIIAGCQRADSMIRSYLGNRTSLSISKTKISSLGKEIRGTQYGISKPSMCLANDRHPRGELYKSVHPIKMSDRARITF